MGIRVEQFTYAVPAARAIYQLYECGYVSKVSVVDHGVEGCIQRLGKATRIWYCTVVTCLPGCMGLEKLGVCTAGKATLGAK